MQLFLDARTTLSPEADPEAVYRFASAAAGAALVAGCGSEDGALDRAAFATFADSADFVKLFEAPLPSAPEEQGE